MPRSSDYIINFKNVSHKFKQGKSVIQVLDSVNFQLKNNCIAALIGASGSGKSTFLHLAGLLEKPNNGKILINDCQPIDYFKKPSFVIKFLITVS